MAVKMVRVGPLGMRVDIPASGVDSMKRPKGSLNPASAAKIRLKVNNKVSSK